MAMNMYLAEELHDPTNHDNPAPATNTQNAKSTLNSGEEQPNPRDGQSQISAPRRPDDPTQIGNQQPWPTNGPSRQETIGGFTAENGETFYSTASTMTTGTGGERDGHASSQYTGVSAATATTVAATATDTTDSRDADDDGGSSSSNAEGSDDGGGGGGGLSDTNRKIAIAVPVAVVGALILAALIFFFLKRRKRKQRRSKSIMTGSPSQTEMNLAPASALSLPQHGSWNPNPNPNHDPGNAPPPPISVTPLPTRRAAPVSMPVPQVQVQDHDALASHSRNVSSDTGRMQSRFTEHEHLEGAPTGAPVVLAAAAGAGTATVGSAAVIAGHARSGSMDRPGSKSSEERPQSPFAHPLDDDADAMSDISEMSGRRSTGRERGMVGQEHDDDVSSVSSFEDDDHHPIPSQRRVGNS